MRFLKLCFFHQTTPPGPIRGSLGPFLISETFNGAIQVLKRLPGIRDTRSRKFPGPGRRGVEDSWCPGRWGVENPWCPGHRGVVF